MGLKGLGAHRWGKGKRGKDIWDRKNLIHGRKGGCYALCVRREPVGNSMDQLDWAGLESLG